ncbi:MAG: cation:proton antiporter, partial [Actinomycetota bacterium]
MRTPRIIYCLLLFVALMGALLPSGAAAAEIPVADAAEVRAGSRVLLVLSGGVGAITAEERARLVNRRVERILHDRTLDPSAIEVRHLPDGFPVIALGELNILEVSAADSEAVGMPPEQLAEHWRSTLRSNLTQLQPLFLRQKKSISVRTLTEHHVLLLIVQIAMLLLAARLFGEVALRLGQPPVIGQLAAGILLGQSFLGALLPDVAALVFPVEATQSYLLEVVSWIGVLFLLMLTGMETDIALIRQQGRPVVFTALGGVLFPFALGFGYGYLLPDRLLTTPESRLVLSLFLGTVLSVSSVPVIAKILSDMQLLRRNVGQLILAGALAHDTAGWIMLAVVASIAAHGSVDLTIVGKTLLGTLLFGVFCATIGRVLVRNTLRWVNDRMQVEHAVLSAVVIMMMLAAAVTQFIGVHAVLGAFAFGILLRDAPVASARVIHPIETVTSAIFAPIFFAAAGLHVNLGVLANPALLVAAITFTLAATVGKVVGSYAGARWGGKPHWDALSVGFGTNARGAMGLIVGILGFSLGILTIDMFSLIIVMAIVTTAITPPFLRWALLKVKADAGEEARLRQEALKERSFIGRIRRVLLPSRGGADAQLATSLVSALGEQQPVEVTGLYVQRGAEDAGAAEAHASVRGSLTAPLTTFEAATVTRSEPEQAILEEVARGYDLLAIGCGPEAGHGESVFGRVVDAVVMGANTSMLVVRAPRQPA